VRFADFDKLNLVKICKGALVFFANAPSASKKIATEMVNKDLKLTFLVSESSKLDSYSNQ
jgi:hypothetical protein